MFFLIYVYSKNIYLYILHNGIGLCYRNIYVKENYLWLRERRTQALCCVEFSSSTQAIYALHRLSEYPNNYYVEWVYVNEIPWEKMRKKINKLR